MKRMTGTLLIVFTLILTMFSGTVSYASAISSIVFEGLDVGDVVEIYRICNYDESSASYTWASAVTTWMTDNRTGKFYADLSPSGLQKMKGKEKAPQRKLRRFLLDGPSKARFRKGRTAKKRKRPPAAQSRFPLFHLLPGPRGERGGIARPQGAESPESDVVRPRGEREGIARP